MRRLLRIGLDTSTQCNRVVKVGGGGHRRRLYEIYYEGNGLC